jgi:hypothetical protein
MARTNVTARNQNFTHEGGPAVPALSVEKQLRRSVLSCLLWEDEFYESGQEIAKRIAELAEKVPPQVLAHLAVEARTQYNLRHVPLLLLTVLSKTGRGDKRVAETVEKVISRADELGELLAIYWKGGRRMVPAQMRKGLDRAIRKFNEYALAKYDRDGAVKLRDVLRIVRPKPENEEQSALWKRAKDRTLATPDTWEVGLSGGGDKKETFTRLLQENKLGYLALLRNLRNMAQAGVDEDLVKRAILARKGGAERVFPFRYVAAARAAPQYEPALDTALQEAIGELTPLEGKTAILVDVSGSMSSKISSKSDLRRIDAAAALASIFPGLARVFVFNHTVQEVPRRLGMAGVDAITAHLGGGTELGRAVTAANALGYDRIIVISDEQTADCVPDPITRKAYMINVASNKHGVGYGPWTHIDGFSEQVLRFIHEVEREG